MSKNWKYFTRDEFKCKHCGENKIEDSFIDLLHQIREEVAFPMPITSGYRCPVHNNAVSSTGSNGPHTTGRAADIAVERSRACDVLSVALSMPEFTGIGVDQKGTGRFIHLDATDRPFRTIWSY